MWVDSQGLDLIQLVYLSDFGGGSEEMVGGCVTNILPLSTPMIIIKILFSFMFIIQPTDTATPTYTNNRHQANKRMETLPLHGGVCNLGRERKRKGNACIAL